MELPRRSETRIVLDNALAPVLFFPKQVGTHEKRGVGNLASDGAQELHTRGDDKDLFC